MVLNADVKSAKKIVAEVPWESRHWRRRCSKQTTASSVPLLAL